jgi:enamine deaminase RidA (YjgF/YER057c/UK114 family)
MGKVVTTDSFVRQELRCYPAMTVVVVAGLIEPNAQVEIEATAVVPD